ncbi:unnamed protein product [Porites lobata]|uniref:Choline/ethanolamine kinase n=1 Tax=Porites lobata TaxID=104759 RepID=A0ABN8QDR2_9CNID|nr:unnamed protein product [Porites lobata]
MASVCDEIRSEFKTKALKWCRKYLGGSWKNLSLDEFSIERLGGGLTNELYICSLPNYCPVINKEKRKVLLRIYGPLYSELVSSSSALIYNIVIFTLLSEREVGPKLYAVFPRGRLEELLPGKCLASSELACPKISVRIARTLAEYHHMELPLSKEPVFMWKIMSGWCKEVEELHINEQDKAVTLAKIKSMNLMDEYYFLRNYLEKATTPGPVTFCHNDLQEGNILRIPKDGQENNEEDMDIMFIDFEYSAYNYRAFDLANHFCEWMSDYSVPAPSYFSLSLSKYPSKEQQLLFVRAYLGRNTPINGTICAPTIEETELLDQIDRFVLASHFLYGLWGVIQEGFSSTGNIMFNYLEYAVARFEAYVQHKKKLGLI